MKKKIATFLVLAIALLVGWKARRQPTQTAADNPRAVIYEMINAGQSGDVQRYLSSYAEPMATTLEKTVSAQYLREISDPVKGVALSDPQKISDTETSIQVQFIYSDRTEAQTYYLSKGSGSWKITGTEDAQRATTLVPYGTPVRLARRQQ